MTGDPGETVDPHALNRISPNGAATSAAPIHAERFHHDRRGSRQGRVMAPSSNTACRAIGAHSSHSAAKGETACVSGWRARFGILSPNCMAPYNGPRSARSASQSKSVHRNQDRADNCGSGHPAAWRNRGAARFETGATWRRDIAGRRENRKIGGEAADHSRGDQTIDAGPATTP
jgi:hypothetical protein